jgi:hypothetical protein
MITTKIKKPSARVLKKTPVRKLSDIKKKQPVDAVIAIQERKRVTSKDVVNTLERLVDEIEFDSSEVDSYDYIVGLSRLKDFLNEVYYETDISESKDSLFIHKPRFNY